MKMATCGFALLTLAGCAGSGDAGVRVPYTPFYGASAAANRAPRGSDAFCRQYGLQTAANRYEQLKEDDNGGGLARVAGREAGERAYRRCLSGRTN